MNSNQDDLSQKRARQAVQFLPSIHIFVCMAASPPVYTRQSWRRSQQHKGRLVTASN